MLRTESLFLFKGLQQNEIEKILADFSNTVYFSKGDVIYSAESFSNAIGFVVNGSAYAITNNSGGLHMKSFANGACFGAAAVFGESEKYVSTIIAKTDIEVLFITEQNLREIFKIFPVTALNYISFLSDKIRFLNTKLSLLSCHNAEDTVYSYLCSVADENGFAHIPKSMTLLSKMLGIGRATLYRSIDTLEAENKILRENNIIKVIKNEKNS